MNPLIYGKRRSLRHLYYSLLLTFSIFINTISQAQTTALIETAPVLDKQVSTLVIAGKEYDRSGYHNFFWGKHYRKEWATPVMVKNFYLDTAKGGLSPVKESGSRQTMGLRLKTRQGNEYILRSIDKDFGNGLT
ncbi:MAG: hypothetical protein ABUT20_35515, partial [Bacteroidota bacterium]